MWGWVVWDQQWGWVAADLHMELGCVGAGGCGVGWYGDTLRLYLLPGLEPILVASTSTGKGQPVVLVMCPALLVS